MVQPTLWAVSVGLAELWRAAGVEPDVVIGHSQGEITAATVAGILSLRGRRPGHGPAQRAGRRAPPDTAGCSPSNWTRTAARAALSGFEELVSLAVDNGPTSCVLSGGTDAVEALQELLEAEGVYCRLVNVDYASHSPQMDELREELFAALHPVVPARRPPSR